ncbi:nucleotide exchange factor GrpE [Candidatus Berkelbacteria bacterium]|nr:nucleotide exchange factor GrpE [Candidatus Berkelbacteria bacterium]
MSDKDSNIEQELQQCQEGWKRTQADFENFRRRINEERQSLHTTIKVETLLELTPIIDNFERAFKAAGKQDQQWLAGFRQIQKQLSELLATAGLKKIETVDQVFDPTRHEALTKKPSSKPVDTILEEVESGFEHDGTIVKPARVILSSGGPEQAEGKKEGN